MTVDQEGFDASNKTVYILSTRTVYHNPSTVTCMLDVGCK